MTTWIDEEKEDLEAFNRAQKLQDQALINRYELRSPSAKPAPLVVKKIAVFNDTVRVRQKESQILQLELPFMEAFPRVLQKHASGPKKLR